MLVYFLLVLFSRHNGGRKLEAGISVCAECIAGCLRSGPSTATEQLGGVRALLPLSPFP